MRKKKTKKKVQPARHSRSFVLSNWFASDIAIDLGTANIIVFVKNKGIVVNEPAVIAVDTMENKVVAIGREAQAMIGRTPRNIHAYHPLRNGVIADYDATEYMLRYFIRRAIGKSLFFKPRVVICVPSSVTNVERRAVIEAAMQAGARKTTVMEEPLAAAIGAGLDIATSNGSMVVDMGGGTTDVAVLSLSGIVISESLRIGSNTFDEAIIRYLEKIKHVTIGQHTAEELKILIGTAMSDGRRMTADVRGRSTETGLPVSIDIDSQEIRLAIDEPIQTVLKTIVSILEKTPPELAADIADHGIVLTGGGLLLDSFDRLISRTTGMAAYLCEDPLLCVAHGAGKAVREMDRLKDSFDDLYLFRSFSGIGNGGSRHEKTLQTRRISRTRRSSRDAGSCG
ncbi:MAG: rod shape-determining protein [Megasphaera massiliensis]|uniref:rod shape-determining protein n=1 Tax=Megasphaera massiliensis TaxID=1232428 RepID=UPI002A75DD9D|nr:rod shape-determining protein [Megasphaera massiliensis]MDY2965607.1 rod shape-determining protein [Megasphaera massiliensis]